MKMNKIWLDVSTFDWLRYIGSVNGTRYQIASKNDKTWIVFKEVTDDNNEMYFSSMGNDISYASALEASLDIESGEFDKKYNRIVTLERDLG